MVREILDALDGIQTQLRQGRAVNVNDKETKRAAIDLASMYFSTVRPYLVEALGESDNLLLHDAEWQNFIKLAHGNNSRGSYRKAVRSLKRGISNFNVIFLSRLSERGVHGSILSDQTRAEAGILQTLDEILPSSAASYRQGILDLRDEQRLSYRGTASEFREALRETLDHLAPDKEVIKSPGFKFDRDLTTPTMKQKVTFVFNSRHRHKTQARVAGQSIDLIDAITGDITRAIYNRASLATHVETTRSEVLKIKRYVDSIFFDLLEISDAS